jgi:hypothetical protein
LHSKIWGGQKKTYIDFAVKAKEFVPNKFYDTMGSLLHSRAKSDMEKCKRIGFLEMAQARNKYNPVPAPNTFTPSMKLVHKNQQACLAFKGPQRAFLDEPFYRGETSPNFYSTKYSQVDKN